MSDLIQSDGDFLNRCILVTGGAGYIGSNTTLQLLDAGYDVVVVDNLCRGNREAVDPARLRVVDLLDTEGLVRVMNEKPCDAVIHFAAYMAVGESMKVPEIYFRNNTAGSLSLFTAMLKAGIRKDRVLVDSRGLRDAGACADSGIGASARR